MPLFDYVCSKCGYRRDDVLVRRFDDPVYCACPYEMVRLPSHAAFVLKGSGFHKNDYDVRTWRVDPRTTVATKVPAGGVDLV